MADVEKLLLEMLADMKQIRLKQVEIEQQLCQMKEAIDALLDNDWDFFIREKFPI